MNMSCSHRLTNSELSKVKSFFSEWETKASMANTGSEVLKLQLEFNKSTLSFLSQVLGRNLTNEDKEKLLQTFKYRHTSLNQFFAGKLEAALYQKQ